MTSKELNLKLVKAFPELETVYHEQTEWQEGDETGSHVVYEDVFVPALLDLIKSKDYCKAKTYFDFVEVLLEEGDDYAIDVMTVSVIESVAFDDVDENETSKLLGAKSLKIWEEYKR